MGEDQDPAGGEGSKWLPSLPASGAEAPRFDPDEAASGPDPSRGAPPKPVKRTPLMRARHKTRTKPPRRTPSRRQGQIIGVGMVVIPLALVAGLILARLGSPVATNDVSRPTPTATFITEPIEATVEPVDEPDEPVEATVEPVEAVDEPVTSESVASPAPVEVHPFDLPRRLQLDAAGTTRWEIEVQQPRGQSRPTEVSVFFEVVFEEADSSLVFPEAEVSWRLELGKTTRWGALCGNDQPPFMLSTGWTTGEPRVGRVCFSGARLGEGLQFVMVVAGEEFVFGAAGS